MVYFADMKCTSGFCIVPCYCIVADDVNRQIGFHGNVPPSHTLACTNNIFLNCISVNVVPNIRRTWYHSNALHTQNSEQEIGYHE